MSSLAAVQADGYYYPPDYDGRKHGSLNKFRGSHPLGDRARKLDQGILTIRFELPWSIWCEGCDSHIGRGVRWNAEKSQAGMYHSTKLWEFKFRCHLCSHTIVMGTDPQNRDYKVVSGARRRIETWDAEANGSVELLDREEKERMLSDPMYKLERGKDDQLVGAEAKPKLKLLYSLQERARDPFSANQALRKNMRERKRKAAVLDAEAKTLNLGFALLPEEASDSRELAGAVFHPGNSASDKARRLARLKLLSGSIFESPGSGAAAAAAAAAEPSSSAAARAHQLRYKALETQINRSISAKRLKSVPAPEGSMLPGTAPAVAIQSVSTSGHDPPASEGERREKQAKKHKPKPKPRKSKKEKQRKVAAETVVAPLVCYDSGDSSDDDEDPRSNLCSANVRK